MSRSPRSVRQMVHTLKQGVSGVIENRLEIGRYFGAVTVKQAVASLRNETDIHMLQRIAAMDRDDLIDLHHGFGTYIRNEYGLWGGMYKRVFWKFWCPNFSNLRFHNFLLTASCIRHFQGDVLVPDDASTVIIKALWKNLKENPIVSNI